MTAILPLYPQSAPAREDQLAEAIGLLTSVLQERLQPPTHQPPTTVGAIIDRYLPHAEAELTPKIYADCRRILTLFKQDLGGRAAADCSPADLKEWIAGHASWRSAWTRKRNNGYVQACFNWARRARLLRENPFAGLPYPSGQRGRPMSAEEYTALINAATPLFRRVISFLHFTGCRPGEMAGLTWDSVDLDKAEIRIDRHKTVKKTCEPRYVQLVPEAVALLRAIQAEQASGAHAEQGLRGDKRGRRLVAGAEETRPASASNHQPPTTNHVFINRTGNPWIAQTLSKRLLKLRERCHLPPSCKLYGCRHYFGTQAALAGLNTFTIAELMGHKDAKTTQHYVHLAERRDGLNQAAQRISL
jgi:integrase